MGGHSTAVDCEAVFRELGQVLVRTLREPQAPVLVPGEAVNRREAMRVYGVSNDGDLPNVSLPSTDSSTQACCAIGRCLNDFSPAVITTCSAYQPDEDGYRTTGKTSDGSAQGVLTIAGIYFYSVESNLAVEVGEERLVLGAPLAAHLPAAVIHRVGRGLLVEAEEGHHPFVGGTGKRSSIKHQAPSIKHQASTCWAVRL